MGGAGRDATRALDKRLHAVTGEAVDRALAGYAAALDGGIERWLRGRPVRPVMRPFA